MKYNNAASNLQLLMRLLSVFLIKADYELIS